MNMKEYSMMRVAELVKWADAMNWPNKVKVSNWPCKVYPSYDIVNIAAAFKEDLSFKVKYKVNIYDKRAPGEWVLEKQVDGDFSHFLYDGRLYHLLLDTNTLLPLNMDFGSETKCRCYKVVIEDGE